jgi:hypothetical protein
MPKSCDTIVKDTAPERGKFEVAVDNELLEKLKRNTGITPALIERSIDKIEG